MYNISLFTAIISYIFVIAIFVSYSLPLLSGHVFLATIVGGTRKRHRILRIHQLIFRISPGGQIQVSNGVSCSKQGRSREVYAHFFPCCCCHSWHRSSIGSEEGLECGQARDRLSEELCITICYTFLHRLHILHQ